MKEKMYHLSENGLTEAPKMPELKTGTRVLSFGAGMAASTWAVYEKTENGYKVVRISESDSYFTRPFNTIDKYTRPIEQKFGIGFYYDLSYIYSEAEVKKALQKANETAKKQTEEAEAKAKGNKKEQVELPKKYPYLIPNPQDNEKITKKNLVAELKKHFPQVKFSVRKEHYGTYNISWTDGVTEESVNEVTGKFISYENDVTGDFRDYSPTNFTRVFGGFKYIFTNRHQSDAINALLPEVKKIAGDDVAYPEQILYKIFCKTTIPANATNFRIEQTDKVAGLEEDFYKIAFDIPEKQENVKVGDVEIVDYSEKAIAVIGDTKPMKDELKAIGGRFNFRLKCGF